MNDRYLYAVLAVLVVLIIVAMFAVGDRRPCADHYLVAPYLDLDELGERGSYYAMSEC